MVSININPLAYTDELDTAQVPPGTANIAFYKSGSAASDLVLSASVDLSNGGSYSLFLADTLKNPEYLLVSNNITAPPAGMANIKFVHLSPDEPAVDLAIHAGSVLFSNISFKGYTDFSSLKADTSYNFEVRPKGASIVLVTLPGITLSAGISYTVYLRGLANTISGNRLSAGIF